MYQRASCWRFMEGSAACAVRRQGFGMRGSREGWIAGMQSVQRSSGFRSYAVQGLARGLRNQGQLGGEFRHARKADAGKSCGIGGIALHEHNPVAS